MTLKNLRFMKSIFQHLFILLLTFISSQTSAQSPDDNKKNSVSTYLGIGAGLDYGGFGIKAEVVPSKYIGIFAGVGYNLADLSYNAGLSAKILPDKKVSPTIMA